MTNTEYLNALEKLGLPPYGKRIAELLGLSLRQTERLAAGHRVSDTIALLITMYLRFGLPDDPADAGKVKPPVSPMPSRLR